MCGLSLSELAVEMENLGSLSPEWYLRNLLSQTMVKLREQSGLKALFDEDRVVAAASNEFIAHGFKVRVDQKLVSILADAGTFLQTDPLDIIRVGKRGRTG